MKRKGFTLIELLVVISIIALLISILMPALNKAREQAKRVMCASHLHQFAMITSQYALDHEDFLPSFEQNTGPIIHSVSNEFLKFITEDYGLEQKQLFCPSFPVEKDYHINEFEWVGGPMERLVSVIIGYAVWIPREFISGPAWGELPPATRGGWLEVPAFVRQWRGPKKISDPEAETNPILADRLCTRGIIEAVDESWDLSVDSYLICKTLDLWETRMFHQWNGVIEITNEAFADTHVEAVPGSKLKPRFGWHRNYWQYSWNWW